MIGIPTVCWWGGDCFRAAHVTKCNNANQLSVCIDDGFIAGIVARAARFFPGADSRLRCYHVLRKCPAWPSVLPFS